MRTRQLAVLAALLVSFISTSAFAQLCSAGCTSPGYCCGDLCALNTFPACFPALIPTALGGSTYAGLFCTAAGPFACDEYGESTPNNHVWNCCGSPLACVSRCGYHGCQDPNRPCGPVEPPCDDCDEIANPFSGFSGASVVKRDDIVLPGALGGIKFARRWNSNHLDWSDDSPLQGIPKPFGTPSADLPEWTHELLAVVTADPDDTIWSVRKPGGKLRRYLACSGTPCWAATAEGNLSTDDRLQRTSTGFVLWQGNGDRLVFESRYVRAAMGAFTDAGRLDKLISSWFLSSIVNSSGATVLTATYQLPPGLSCAQVGLDAGTSAGVPYLYEIQSPEAKLRLSYASLTPASGPAQCVIRNVGSVLPDAGVDPVSLVTFAYFNDGTAERPGRIITATTGSPAVKTETYSYGTDFVRSQAGTELTRHSYSSGKVVADTSIGMDLDVEWGTGACEPDSACCDTPVQALVSSLTAQRGDGTTGIASLETEYLSLSNEGQQHQPRLYQQSDSCSVPGACSPGTIRHEWTCSTSTMPGYEKAVKNKRDNWEAYTVVAVDGGMPRPVLERRAVARGASDMDGGSALETETYTYTYGSSNQQLPASTTRASVVSSGSTVEKRWYDSNNRLSKTTRFGYFKDYDQSTTGSRIIASFFSTSRSCGGSAGPDALGRTLEMRGPCFVNSETDTACSTTSGYPIPVTVYEYWASTETTNGRKNRLKAVRRYVNGADDCTSGTPLSTLYDSYDALGNAQSVTDEAGNVATFTFDGAGQVLTRTKGGNTTSFAYDNGKLSRIIYPYGNAELFCYRTSSNAGCTTGAWTPQLQWKAKMACTPSGAGCSTTAPSGQWTELVNYTAVPYAADGTVAREEYRGCYSGTCTGPTAGELRRATSFSADAHQRPTWRETGVATGKFASTSFFDRADNLAGVGLPFNTPPAFCGGPGSGSAIDEPTSKLCAALKYDRAERLASFTEYPTGAVGSAQATCFGYDAHGNVNRVTPGCTGTCNSDGTCGSLGDAYSTQYQWDDFGNRTAVQAAWTSGSGSSGKGFSTFVFDAMGNVVLEQNPEQHENGTSQFTFYSFDALGRPLYAKVNLPTGINTLWTMGYDSSASPSNCPTLANTGGRLSHRLDGYGDTYYSYDVEGRVTKEVRIRYYGTSCTVATGYSEPAGYKDIYYSPHTFMSYDVNGNLTTLELPHGRTVTYNYGADGARDRVISVDVTRRQPGDSWSTKRLIEGVTWEPYGGLRRYQGKGSNVSFDGGSDFTVEYMLGDNASVRPSTVCSSTAPSAASSDFTGRMRALFVTAGTSAALGAGNGDIYRRWYTYKADVPTRIEACLLGESTPRVSQFDYDVTLRLTVADGGYPNGPTGVQTFSFDPRGNRDGGIERNLATGYALTNKDRLSSLTRSDGLTRTYQWDRSGLPARDGGFYFGPNGAGQKGIGFDYYYGSGATFRAASVGAGLWFNYGYDAYNRRTIKQYPTGTSDEYFYDQGHQMLADRGMADVLTSGTYTMDEYVWLGGRPVAVARGLMAFWGGLAHRYDDSLDGANCTRMGDNVACGFYFPVTDALGTPVLMLDANARVTGVNDMDTFGYPNRGQVSAKTAQPYADSQSAVTLGSYQLSTAGTSSTVKTDTRVKFAVLEVLPDGGDGVFLQNGASSTPFLSGLSSGPTWTSWLNVPTGSMQTVDVKFTSNASGHTNGGAVAEAFEYRRYQASAAAPFFTPLRFPGQYHDLETDFFENWNRYYDPFTGRYLQPDPMITVTGSMAELAAYGGGTFNTYGYGGNAPTFFYDSDGKWIYTTVRYGAVRGNDCFAGLTQAGVTCPDPAPGEPTECKQVRQKPRCPCGPDNKCTWGFDIIVDVKIGISLRDSPDTFYPEEGRTLVEHEASHYRDLADWWSAGVINSRIQTEGFKTVQACRAARSAIKENIKQYKVVGNVRTRIRQDMNEIMGR